MRNNCKGPVNLSAAGTLECMCTYNAVKVKRWVLDTVFVCVWRRRRCSGRKNGSAPHAAVLLLTYSSSLHTNSPPLPAAPLLVSFSFLFVWQHHCRFQLYMCCICGLSWSKVAGVCSGGRVALFKTTCARSCTENCSALSPIQSGRHLDKVVIACVKFVLLHNSSLQDPAPLSLALSLSFPSHSFSSSLARFISSYSLSHFLSALSSRALSSYSPFAEALTRPLMWRQST